LKDNRFKGKDACVRFGFGLTAENMRRELTRRNACANSYSHVLCG